MRKNLWQIALLLLAFTASGNDNSSAVWNSGNNFPGWKHFSNATGIVADGVITMTDIRFDCRMSNFKVNFDPKNYDTFTYTYRAFDGAGKRGGELFFSHIGEKFSDKRSWPLPPMVADGQWHTVSVTPDDFTSFRTGGMITSLRFDPTNSAGGKIEIKELKFEKRFTPPEKIIWDKNNFALWTYSYNTKKEVGLVYVALSVEGETFCRELRLGLDRTRVRTTAANHALDMIRRYLTGLDMDMPE